MARYSSFLTFLSLEIVYPTAGTLRPLTSPAAGQQVLSLSLDSYPKCLEARLLVDISAAKMKTITFDSTSSPEGTLAYDLLKGKDKILFDRMASGIVKSKKVVVVVGAGISCSSGIPVSCISS